MSEQETQAMPNSDDSQKETTNEITEEVVSTADYDSLQLELARTKHLLSAYAPEGIEIDAELAHVIGLSVVEGVITGEAQYRKPASAQVEQRPSRTLRRTTVTQTQVDNSSDVDDNSKGYEVKDMGGYIQISEV